MRWHRIFKRPAIGEKRIKRRFLFFPKRIECLTRWLEFAEWEDEFTEEWTSMEDGGYSFHWRPLIWTDLKEKG